MPTRSNTTNLPAEELAELQAYLSKMRSETLKSAVIAACDQNAMNCTDLLAADASDMVDYFKDGLSINAQMARQLKGYIVQQDRDAKFAEELARINVKEQAAREEAKLLREEEEKKIERQQTEARRIREEEREEARKIRAEEREEARRMEVERERREVERELREKTRWSQGNILSHQLLLHQLHLRFRSGRSRSTIIPYNFRTSRRGIPENPRRPINHS